MVIMGELAYGLDMSASSAESLEDLSNTSTWLHGDDSQLILFVDPDEESLLLVMENTSSRWPVSVEISSSKIFVTFLEEEVIFNQLLLGGSVHTLERIELTLEVSLESIACFNNLVHDFESLRF